MREEVFLLGRILFAMIFIGAGAGQFADLDGSKQYAASKNVPSPDVLVPLAAVAKLLGGIAVVLGIWLDLAGLLLAVLVMIIAFMMHRFWEETDDQMKQMEMSMFMKNLSIAGGGVILAAIGTVAPYTITDGVF